MRTKRRTFLLAGHFSSEGGGITRDIKVLRGVFRCRGKSLRGVFTKVLRGFTNG